MRHLLFFLFSFAFYILDIEGNTELEVILNSSHKLDRFSFPLHIFKAADLYPLEMDAVLPSGEHTL